MGGSSGGRGHGAPLLPLTGSAGAWPERFWQLSFGSSSSRELDEGRRGGRFPHALCHLRAHGPAPGPPPLFPSLVFVPSPLPEEMK